MKRLAAVPIFNGERFLEQTLRSLLQQSVPPDQIICIDDASTDASAAIVRSFEKPSLRLIQNRERLGLARNWNLALNLARGFDSLTIAHQDDIYEPEYLQKVTEALENHPSAFIAHTKATVIDERGRVVTLPATRYKDKFWPNGSRAERSPAEELRLLIRGDYIFCPSVTFRASALADIGEFDENLEFVPDWDFWLRGLLRSHTIVGVNEKLIRYRSHPQSATKMAERTLRRYREEIEIIDRYSGVISDANMPVSARYRPAENTLTGGIIHLLLAGDSSEAKRLLDFGKEHIPGFRRRLAGMVLTLAVPFGRIGGRILQIGMRVYLRVIRRPR